MPAARAKTKPLLEQDPFAELRADIRGLHDCVHKVGERVDQVANEVNSVKVEVAYIKGRQDAVATRVGVPEDGSAPTKNIVFFTERWKAITAIVGAISALMGLVALIVAAVK